MSTRREFLDRFSFDLDPFQIDGMDAIDRGSSVLVAAPTGAGKTIVGEYAVHRAISQGVKVFYTAPIKALSNQKHQELVEWLGHDRVGLITGDTSINPMADVVVMTTEILRNMMYADSPALMDLGFVVMDEVHYLADRFRGPVWEELIIHLPRTVALVALSATVSNIEEFGAWVDEVRGTTEVIVSDRRPVPLWQHVLFDHDLVDVFLDLDGNPTPAHGPEVNTRYREINPALQRLGGHERPVYRGRNRKGRGSFRERRHEQRMRPRGMSRADIVHALAEADLLPAIFFIFSRAGCDQAVGQLMRANVELTTPEERRRIRAAFRARFADLAGPDADALGMHRIERAALAGVASHHAGQLPMVKTIVEDLFAEGLIKLVFATETLALGINMPARTVVLDQLKKFNGTEHAPITPGEYTQLTGRAGRRGIDTEGHAVVAVMNSTSAQEVAGLASKRTYPLKSAFRPTYNMTVNLLDRFNLEDARDTLDSSFAQFQTDRSVVSQARRARDLEETAEQYRQAITCEQGDIVEYADLLEQISEREKALGRDRAERERTRARQAVKKLRRGDIVQLPGGRRQGYGVVIWNERRVDGPHITAVTTDGQFREYRADDFRTRPAVIGTMRTADPDRLRAAKVRRDTGAALKKQLAGHGAAARPPKREPSTAAEDTVLLELRSRLREHPCHSCEDIDAHMRWISRYRKAARQRDKALRSITQRTSYLAREFDRVLEVLHALGYVERADNGSTRITDKGHLLERIFSDRDLVICEGITEGVFTGLKPPMLAAVASSLCYEPRRDDSAPEEIADRAFGRALHALGVLTDQINAQERPRGLDVTQEPCATMAGAVHRWALGQGFASSVGEMGAAPGDFVRHVRQVIDLLEHMEHIGGSDDALTVAVTARQARSLLQRGIVAQDM
ncbi:DEAD/DEAH box helicase [Helcobacillus massiliensis]|uniref:ATP-dependent RNA helicase HelY n=1 Tax=Helcobacillus massiliensis TaxID=521392 RepID=A0A839QYE3_9MICO|nr:DEAD/DEAH box helicase [Helcobacillus massiliensis]MBB3022427.1 ATP-dependent RNA helicase HelY [Helcobacillus massiliensis]